MKVIDYSKHTSHDMIHSSSFPLRVELVSDSTSDSSFSESRGNLPATNEL
jgi:hypothetical protein